jgi:uncharacterized membrane protein
MITVCCYFVALFIYVLDNLLKTITTTAQLAFKVYTVDSTSAKHSIEIVDLVLMAINSALYNTFLQFFWNKIFCGRQDILAIHRRQIGP